MYLCILNGAVKAPQDKIYKQVWARYLRHLSDFFHGALKPLDVIMGALQKALYINFQRSGRKIPTWKFMVVGVLVLFDE